MFLAPLAALLLYPGQTVEQKISFSQPAMTLERLLPKLGEAAGVKMEADKSIKNEVVLISAKDVSVKGLMAKVAKAACGEWENQDSNMVLKLNRAQDKTEREADWRKKLAKLQTLLDGLAEQIGIGNSKRKAYFSPGDQEAFKILRLVPLDAIAKLGQMESVVFAYPATGSQYRLPAACVPLAQDILSKTPNRLPGDLSKVMLVVNRFGQINIKVRIIRNDGIVMADSHLTLYNTSEPPVTQPIALAHPDAKISIAEGHKAIVGKIGLFARRGQFVGWGTTSCEDYISSSYTEAMFNPTGYARLTDEQDLCLRKPDEHEPLSIGLGDAISAFAETQEVNLVACLPDAAENQACIDLKEQSPSASTMVQLAAGWGLNFDVDGKWCMLRPQVPSEARDRRLDRKILRNIVDQAGYQKLPSLDLLSRYCAEQPLLDPEQSFEMTWLRMNCPETAKTLYNVVPNRCLMRFWGQLSPAQRTNLASGGTISFAALPIEQKMMIAKAMPKMYIKVDPMISDQTDRPGDLPIFNTINDYSEIVPFPDLMQAEICGSSSKRAILLGIAENGERSVFDFTKISLMDMSLPRDPLNPEIFMLQCGRLVFPYYQPGRRTSMKLQIRLLSKPARINSLSFIHNLNDDGIPEGAMLINRKELPQPYLKWLNRQLKNVQELEQQLESINRQEKRP